MNPVQEVARLHNVAAEIVFAIVEQNRAAWLCRVCRIRCRENGFYDRRTNRCTRAASAVERRKVIPSGGIVVERYKDFPIRRQLRPVIDRRLKCKTHCARTQRWKAL